LNRDSGTEPELRRARGQEIRAPSPNSYHPPLTVTRRALLKGGNDVEFRRLIYRLLLVEERLRRARDYLARLAGLTGPQYTMLITVAYLQGATGITVQALARNLRVTSAFITTESRRLIERGLLAKRTNPHDSRSALLSVTAAGRRRIERLVPELRRINNAFFAHVTARSFTEARRFLEQLLAGSEQVMAHIARHA
jgi:MarR family transcriptional regulator, organic hydroperoxide resistance regulator